MGKIVLEDFNEGNGYYKVNLAYLSKKQVEEIEALVSTWNPTDEDIKSCIGMCLTDANEQRFKDYNTNLKDCLTWLEKQGNNLVKNGYTKNKDYIRYADKYSHEIWRKLMDNFKNIKDYHIGCNDVSDIVLNAIIDTFNCFEKQGKQKPVLEMKTPEESLGIDSDTYNKIVDECIYGEQKPYGQRKECSDCQFNYAGECKGSCQIKRDEQKPADFYCQENCKGFQETGKCFADGDCKAKREAESVDKLEPKFHEGEWVFIEEVKGYKNGPFQIKTVDSFGYSFDEYHTIPFMYEELLSKWTIQDAKDGDVLAFSCTSQNYILIYKGLYEKSFKTIMSVFCSYCVEEDTYYDETDSFHIMNCGEIITPATKEQRDTLFAKMKEAWYEWDAEKKELKKIK